MLFRLCCVWVCVTDLSLRRAQSAELCVYTFRRMSYHWLHTVCVRHCDNLSLWRTVSWVCRADSHGQLTTHSTCTSLNILDHTMLRRLLTPTGFFTGFTQWALWYWSGHWLQWWSQWQEYYFSQDPWSHQAVSGVVTITGHRDTIDIDTADNYDRTPHIRSVVDVSAAPTFIKTNSFKKHLKHCIKIKFVYNKIN